MVSVTEVVARVLMDVWTDLLATNLAENGVSIYLLAKYVNDVSLAVSPVPLLEVEDTDIIRRTKEMTPEHGQVS